MHAARVLLAEEFESDQNTIRRMLESYGCVVELVQDGFEAVHAVRHNSYDLILLERYMPVLDGTEAARIIRELAGADHIPIVIINPDGVVSELELPGVIEDSIAKPVSLTKLEKVLCKYVFRDAETGPPEPTLSKALA